MTSSNGRPAETSRAVAALAFLDSLTPEQLAQAFTPSELAELVDLVCAVRRDLLVVPGRSTE